MSPVATWKDSVLLGRAVLAQIKGVLEEEESGWVTVAREEE